MSYTPGQFTETLLMEQRYRADQMMLDKRIALQYQPQIDALFPIMGLQTASLNTALNARDGKEYDVEITWMNACDDFEIEDVSCAIGGNSPSTNTKLYTLKKRFAYGFSVAEDTFRDNEYDQTEAIAKSFLRIDKEASEALTRYLITFLNASAGVNAVADRPGFTTDAVNRRTDIDAAEWTAPIMAYLARVMLLNRLQNGLILTGSNLYETHIVDRANGANADGKGDVVLWNGMQFAFDPFNVDGVNNADMYTYLLTQGAHAIVNKTWNPDAPTPNFHDIRYTMPSRFMPGIKYDVFYNNECQTSEGDAFAQAAEGVTWREHLVNEPNLRDGNFRSDALQHNYKIVLTAEAFLNPLGCDESNLGTEWTENTGILRLRNV